MPKLLLDKGRIGQKLKTREALILKANELLKQGHTISVDFVAKEAGISKATAYRYFSTMDALKREASLHLKSTSAENLFDDLGSDIGPRIDRLINYHYKLFLENENEFRLFLSSVIAESVSKPSIARGGRRIVLIEEALEPIKDKMDEAEFENVINTLSLVFGIESITVLKDVCGLNDTQILDNWKWTVGRILSGLV